MNAKEISETVERYNKRLDQYGITEQTLGWGEKGRSRLRFEILTSRWDFDNTSVLDAGCGFGDLYDYMVEKGFANIHYHGMDINNRFIDIAKKKHRETVKFSAKNFLDANDDEHVDFILSSGVFNHKLENNIGFVKDSFEKFNALSKRGFAVNFLSDQVSYMLDYAFHAHPSGILELAYKYSNNVVLRNDYMPFEFTIFVNKFSEIDERLTVYKEFEKYV